MAWSFISNPFISMSGPDFLITYYFLVVVLWVITKALLGSWPRSSKVIMPTKLDASPYFIAWLKHREDGALLQGVGTLLQKEYLEQTKENYVRTVKTPANDLDENDRKVLKHFAREKHVLSVSRLIKEICGRYEKHARAQALILSERQLLIKRRIVKAGALLILALAAYKLFVALITGHSNVLFLVFSAPILSLIYYISCRPKSSVVNSATGNALLEHYRCLLSCLREKDKAQVWLLWVLAGTVTMAALVVPSPASASAGAGGDSGGDNFSSSSDSGGGDSGGGSGCGGCGGGD